MLDYRLITELKTFIERNYAPKSLPVSLKRVTPPFFEPAPAPSALVGAYLTRVSEFDKNLLKAKIEDGARFSRSFTAKLFEYIDKSKFETDADFYNDIGISRQTFSRIRSPRNAGDLPNKKNILIMAIGLELSAAETEELLNLAGYALRINKKQDIIIKYFLQERKFDKFLIDDALCEFGEEPFFSAG